MKWTLRDALAGCSIEVVSGSLDTVIDGAAVDSRKDVTGRLFVGLSGESGDGGRYAVEALASGASAAIVSKGAWQQIAPSVAGTKWTVITADDPLLVLQAAGTTALRRSGATVIGITGSVGKTTTKDILVGMLAAAGTRVSGTPGNQNTEIGVPLAMLELEADTEVAVVEMGMRGAGQIAELVHLVTPHVVCITSIAPVHLEILGTIDAIAQAKAEILCDLGPGDIAVVPRDEPLLDPFVHALPAGVEVRRFDDLPDGVAINLTKSWQRTNAAAAWQCCLAIGRAPRLGEAIFVELSAMRGQERFLVGGGVLIEDCYNANPIAMRAALRDLSARNGRRIAVLGDMMELGPDEAKFHREIGEYVAELGIDLLVGIGPRSVHYLEGAVGVESVHFPDAVAATPAVAGLLSPGDTVLVKASRSVALERVCEVLT